jgi:putative transposase
VIAADGLPVQLAARVLGVSESGYYQWRDRPLSARAIRHAWLTGQIRAVHQASRQACGSRRVHAELTLGAGIIVGHGTAEMLMRHTGIKGLPGTRHPPPPPKHQTRPHPTWCAASSPRPVRDELWVTDITDHPTQEGKVYCALEYLEIFHNRQRRHSALGMLTPIQYELSSRPAEPIA